MNVFTKALLFSSLSLALTACSDGSGGDDGGAGENQDTTVRGQYGAGVSTIYGVSVCGLLPEVINADSLAVAAAFNEGNITFANDGSADVWNYLYTGAPSRGTANLDDLINQALISTDSTNPSEVILTHPLSMPNSNVNGVMWDNAQVRYDPSRFNGNNGFLDGFDLIVDVQNGSDIKLTVATTCSLDDPSQDSGQVPATTTQTLFTNRTADVSVDLAGTGVIDWGTLAGPNPHLYHNITNDPSQTWAEPILTLILNHSLTGSLNPELTELLTYGVSYGSTSGVSSLTYTKQEAPDPISGDVEYQTAFNDFTFEDGSQSTDILIYNAHVLNELGSGGSNRNIIVFQVKDEADGTRTPFLVRLAANSADNPTP